EPQPRLEHRRVGLREAPRHAAGEPLQARVGGGLYLALGLGRETVAGEDHAVVGVARPRHDRARAGVDAYRLARIVELGIEHGRVVELRVERGPLDVAYAALDGQLVARLPAVLHERVHGQRAP